MAVLFSAVREVETAGLARLHGARGAGPPVSQAVRFPLLRSIELLCHQTGLWLRKLSGRPGCSLHSASVGARVRCAFWWPLTCPAVPTSLCTLAALVPH